MEENNNNIQKFRIQYFDIFLLELMADGVAKHYLKVVILGESGYFGERERERERKRERGE